MSWIKLHRSLSEHWIWNEKREFSKAEAWIDLLLNLNYSESKTIIKGKVLICNRGESICSLDTYASRWRWNKSKVRRFLNLLEKDEMIRIKNETVTTRITVCNYESYQDLRNESETQTKRRRNADETHATPIEERKNNKKERIKTSLPSYEMPKGLNLNKISPKKIESLESWIKYLVEDHKKRPTATQINTLIIIFGQYKDEDVKACVNNSISQGYKSLIWDKFTKIVSLEDIMPKQYKRL